MSVFLLLALVTLASAQDNPGSDFEYLMVVGGPPSSSESKVQVLDLTDEAQTCPPVLAFTGAADHLVGTFIGGRPLVCGGQASFETVSASCHTYIVDANAWEEAAFALLTPRKLAAGVILSETEWWVTGGQADNSGSAMLASTEIYTVGEGFSPYVDLPAPNFGHNLVRVNATHYVLLGGDPGGNQVWMFDRTAEEWSRMPDLLERRRMSHAGLVTYPDGHQALVVAGGDIIKSTEVFDLTGPEWRFVSALPVIRYFFGGASVQYRDTVLIVGGYGDGYFEMGIWRFDAEEEVWVSLPQQMADPRRQFAAFAVPQDGWIECSASGE